MNLIGELRYQVGDGTEAKLQFTESLNSLSLDIVFVPNNARGFGVGTILMRRLLILADLLHKAVYLTARPLGVNTPESLARLVRFYERYGFEAYDHGETTVYMVRHPFETERFPPSSPLAPTGSR